MTTKTLCAGMLLVAASACAKSAQPAQPTPDAAPAAQASAPRNRDIITREELQAPNVISMSVLDAVRSLRPRFLTVRGLNQMPATDPKIAATGIDPHPLNDGESGKVHSSIDGAKVGPLNDLTGIRASTVKEIRYLDVAAAHQKFGSSSFEGPVILVVTM